MKKTLLVLAFVGLVLLFFTGDQRAEASFDQTPDMFYSKTLPNRMAPGSRIRFVSSVEFVIEKGGVVEDTFTEWSALVEQIPGVICEKYPDPVAGLVVTYASDGLIDKMYYPEGVHNPLLDEMSTVGKKGKHSIIPCAGGRIEGYPYDSAYIIARWGAYPNTLYYCICSVDLTKAPAQDDWVQSLDTGNSSGTYIRIIGVGRGTTFSDTIGQEEIRLKKGDAATKLAYDNCTVGTHLTVMTKTKAGVDKAGTLIKRDAGGMPNAVLDIWKTGVEYWGYTWNLDFSMPHKVVYTYTYTEADR